MPIFLQKLILASSSPRRLELLKQINIIPDNIISPEIDESPLKREKPCKYAERMALEKLNSARLNSNINNQDSQNYILAADTVVAVGSRILPKAENIEDAIKCLKLLSGRGHRVYTSIAVLSPNNKISKRTIESRVKFKKISDLEMELYINSKEWEGKAGGYAIQGVAGAFIIKIIGSYSAIVGLPLYETASLLGGAGFDMLKK